MMQGSLAMRLRVLRAERGLSLTEAAERAGIQRQTLALLERGERHPHDPKIAKGYGVPVDELLEEPVPLAEVSETGQTEAEERDTPGVAPDVLFHLAKFTAQLADVLEAEIEGVEQNRTFPYFAWDYRIEATISHLARQLDESEILAYVAEV